MIRETASSIFEWLQNLVRQFRFVTFIYPWEHALRVRLGDRLKVLAAGPRLVLPFVDRIVRLPSRLQVLDLPTQTVTTRRGQPLTLSGAIGYCVTDIEQVFMSVHSPEATLYSVAMGAVADTVWNQDVVQNGRLQIDVIEQAVVGALRPLEAQYGLRVEWARITDAVIVRTYRLVMGEMGDRRYGDRLPTEPPRA